MARNVAFYVSTTNNTVKVVDTDAQGTIVGGATTGFGCWSADMTLLDLTNAQATLKMRNVFGHTVGVFTYAELGAVTINGVDQSGSIANLSQFEAIFAPYLYQDDLSMQLSAITAATSGQIKYANERVDGTANSQDLVIGGANAVSVYFSITDTTALATNTVEIWGSIDGLNFYKVGSAYTGTGDFASTLNFTTFSDTTVARLVRVQCVDGGAGTMSTQVSILAVR